jgi:tyrosinase
MKSFSFALTGLSAALFLGAGARGAALSNGTVSGGTAGNGTLGGSCPAVEKTDENSYFSVVGVQGTGVQVRRELRELEKDAETWNLFVQAFARFQGMDQTDKVSYFQVACMVFPSCILNLF